MNKLDKTMKSRFTIFLISLFFLLFSFTSVHAETLYDTSELETGYSLSNSTVTSSTFANFFLDTSTIDYIDNISFLIYNDYAGNLYLELYNSFNGTSLATSSSVASFNDNTNHFLDFDVNFDSSSYNSIYIKVKSTVTSSNPLKTVADLNLTYSYYEKPLFFVSSAGLISFGITTPTIITGTSSPPTCNDGCIDPDECETCETCEVCTLCGDACANFYSDDLSLITGCEQTYSASTSETLSTTYKFFHIPIIVFSIFALIIGLFFFRMMKEFIIRLRQ